MPLTRNSATYGFIVLAFAWALPSVSLAASASDAQRALFKQVFADVERGNWAAVEALPGDDRRLLEDYVLYPDLRAAYFRATIDNADHGEVEAWLDRFGVLKPARELRYRYALHLAEIGHLADYLEIYEQFYQGLDDPRLDCIALRAELEAGRPARVVQRALDLWTVGESQVEECDPVFDYLRAENLLSASHYLERFGLAIEAREFSMARWLGRSIGPEHVDVAGRWIRAQRDPEAFARNYRSWPNDAATREQLVYAVERITYRDPLVARELWEKMARGDRFALEQALRTERHIALWMARDRLPGAHAQLATLPPAAQNDEVMRWRARTSLRLERWHDLLVDIEAMRPGERNSEEWRYWYAIALQNNDRVDDAEALLAELAGERSYYGFLAADALGLPYALADEQFAIDEARCRPRSWPTAGAGIRVRSRRRPASATTTTWRCATRCRITRRSAHTRRPRAYRYPGPTASRAARACSCATCAPAPEPSA